VLSWAGGRRRLHRSRHRVAVPSPRSRNALGRFTSSPTANLGQIFRYQQWLSETIVDALVAPRFAKTITR